MDASILKVVGQVAGVAGIALGVLLLVFRDVIRKQIFSTLTKDQSYRLLRLLLVLTWSIALAGIAAWVWASGRTSPVPPSVQANFEFRDSLTNDPVYRSPLKVEYSVAGKRQPVATLAENHRGKWTVEAAADDVTIEGVTCRGYQFDPVEQGELPKGIVQLDRSHLFGLAITPRFDDIEKVSLPEYRAEVANQNVERGIRLTCKNETRFSIDLVLKRWVPEGEIQAVAATRTNTTWLRPCPPEDEKEYAVDDFQPGGYYYVFGSVCGLEGQQVWNGSLHGPPDPVLVVTMIESAAEDPKLSAVALE